MSEFINCKRHEKNVVAGCFECFVAIKMHRKKLLEFVKNFANTDIFSTMNHYVDAIKAKKLLLEIGESE